MNQTIDAGSLLSQMRLLQAQAGSAGSAESAALAQADSGFAPLLGQLLDKVAQKQQAARALASAFEIGESDTDISEVMIAMQKANLSFAALTQVRNKLVQAYQDIMQMPV